MTTIKILFSSIIVAVFVISLGSHSYAQHAHGTTDTLHPPTQIGLPGAAVSHDHGGGASATDIHDDHSDSSVNAGLTRDQVKLMVDDIQKEEENRSVLRFALLSLFIVGIIALFYQKTTAKILPVSGENMSDSSTSIFPTTTIDQNLQSRFFLFVKKYFLQSSAGSQPNGIGQYLIPKLQKMRSELQQTGLVLGGLLLSLLGMTIISGIALSFFYDPTPGGVYRAMDTISAARITSFIRNFHFWSSDMLLFVLFLHMTRVALTKPSGKARRYAWWIGIGLLILVGTEMLLGTFMRGDQEALEAYSHFFIGTTDIVAQFMPFITIVTDFFSKNSALFRFFVLHSIVVPFSILSLIILHGLFAPTFRTMIAPWKKISDAAIRGSLKPEGVMQAPSVKKIMWLTFISFSLVVLLSGLFPAPLHSPPYAALEVTKPPWWLLWIVAMENWWGLTPIILAPPILFAIFAAIPLLVKDKPGADIGVYVYLTTIAIVLMLGFYAAVAPQVAHTEHFLDATRESEPQ